MNEKDRERLHEECSNVAFALNTIQYLVKADMEDIIAALTTAGGAESFYIAMRKWADEGKPHASWCACAKCRGISGPYLLYGDKEAK